MSSLRLPESRFLKSPAVARISALLGAAVLFLTLAQVARAPQAQAGPGSQPNPASATRPELELQIGHMGALRAVAFSRDGKTVATGGDEGAIKLWEVATGALRHTLRGHRATVVSMAFSPDDKTLASASEDGTVGLWDARTGRPLRALTGHTSGLRSVAFSRDGRTLASGSWDAMVKLWDVPTGKELRTLTGHQGPVVSVTFSLDGKAVASVDETATLKLWDAATGEPRRTLTLPGEAAPLQCAAFARDGRTLAGGRGGEKAPSEILLWDVETGALQRRLGLTGHTGWVLTVAFSADGRTIASGSSDDWKVRLWDVDTGTLRRTLDYDSRVTAVAFSPNGRLLISGSDARTAKLWEVQTGVLRRTLGRSDDVLTAAFSADGKTIASGSQDHTVRLWDSDTGALQRVLTRHTARVGSVAFSPDGRMLASGSAEGVTLWDARTGAELRSLTEPRDNGSQIAFTPDGKTLMSGSFQELRLWDVATGTLRQTLTGHTDTIVGLALSPDGKTIATGAFDTDRTVRLWDVGTGEVLRTLTEHTPKTESVAFSPDGRTVASGGGDSAKLWDVQSGQLLWTMAEPTAEIAYSPDGKILGMAASGGVKLLNAQTGELLRTLTGHIHGVNCLDFSPDGTRVISGGYDGTVRVWDTSSGRLLATLIALPPARPDQPPSDWLAVTPEGYYDASPGAARFIQWRVGNDLFPMEAYERSFYRPDLLQRSIVGEPVPAPTEVRRFASGRAIPPQVTVTVPRDRGTAPGDTLRIELTITDDRSVVRVEVRVNGRPVEVRPIPARNKPITAGSKPIAAGAKRIQVGGKTIGVAAKPIAVGSKPITAGGKPVPSAHRFLHRFQVDLPLPLGEPRVTVKAIAYDDEALQGWAEVELTRPVPTAITGDLYVLAVGVSQYRSPRLNLRYAAADASAFARLWKPMEGTLYRRVIVTPLTDAQATAANVRAALFRLLETVTPRDNVALFLSGHGVQAGDGRFYFASHEIDATTPQRVEQTALPWTVFETTLAKVDAKRVFLFLDACHSGSALGEQQASNERLAEALVKRGGVMVFASSRGGEFSYEDEALRHGAFTAALVEGIGQGKADLAIGGVRDGKITAEELLAYLRARVPQMTGNRQTPTCPLIYDFGEAFLLARRG